MNYSDIDYDELCGCKGIIITGSSYNVSYFDVHPYLAAKFTPVMSIIRGLKSKPILGICFGFHLTAAAFDVEVHRMDIESPGNQLIPVAIEDTDDLIPYEDLTVNVFHRDYVDPEDRRARDQFEVIGTHDYHGYSTVQYMKHKSRLIYAVQFHPETHDPNFPYGPEFDVGDVHKARIQGESIIHNFLDLCLNHDHQ